MEWEENGDVHRITNAGFADLTAIASERINHILPAVHEAVAPRVAVCVTDGPLMPLAMVSVIRAGGCLVPIDPHHPYSRISSILQDASPFLLIALDRDIEHLNRVMGAIEWESGGHIEVISAESLYPQLQIPHHSSLSVSSDWPFPQHLMQPYHPPHVSHIFYTSGSTGTPKGCCGTLQALRNYAHGKNTVHGISATSRVLIASHITFDPCLGDVFSALVAGAVICVGHSLLGNLRHTLSLLRVTHVCTTPALWQTVGGWDEGLAGLECVALGGEPCPVDVSERWRAKVRWVITYGVTEACVYQTCYVVPGAGQGVEFANVVGSPLPGVEIALLDHEQREICEEGVEGEIAIRGIQVGEGYWRRPELCTVFSPSVTGERQYRTGDWGYWATRSGTQVIVYGGRRDNQVKVRGTRVELGEVESAAGMGLCAAVVVSGCAACAQDGSLVLFTVLHSALAEDLRLEFAQAECGVWVAIAPQAVEEAIRHQVRRTKPEVFVPSRVVVVRELPLTPSGKIDRKRLPPFREVIARCVPEHTPPTPTETVLHETLSELESAVARVWVSVLAIDTIHPTLTRTDSFTNLGGDSLAALRACREVSRALSRVPAGEAVGDEYGTLHSPFTPQELLQHPQLGDYVTYIETHCATAPVMPANVGPGNTSGADVNKARHCSPPEVLIAHHSAACGAQSLLTALLTPPPALTPPLLTPEPQYDGWRKVAPTATHPATRCSLLHTAAYHGHSRLCESLLDVHKVAITCLDANKQTALHWAARSSLPGTAAVCRVLCTRLVTAHPPQSRVSMLYGGCVLDWRDRWLRTPLHWAVLNGQALTVQMLLECGASAAPTTVRASKRAKSTHLVYETPLEIARRLNRGEIEAMLLRHSQSARVDE